VTWRTLEELLNTKGSAWPLVQWWVRKAMPLRGVERGVAGIAAADILLRFFAERLRKATRRILGLSLGALLSRPRIEALRPAGSRRESMRPG
jgi:hypothetical protein